MAPTEHDLWINSGVPTRHKRCEPNTVAVEAWSKTRDDVAMKLGGGFLFGMIGPRGTGKTQIASDVARMACKKLWDAKYATAMDIFLDIRATYQAESATVERDVIADYVKPRLLIIDELQERGDSPWENRVLTHLIDKRYGAMHDTILIANLLPQAFKDNVGESIWDRLNEVGGLIECVWGSWRVAK